MLALLVAGLAACGGSSAATPAAIEIGTTGGNIIPTKAVLEADGHVQGSVLSMRGHGPPRHLLPESTVLSFDRQVGAAFAAGLASRQCPGVLPDFASAYIAFKGKTVTVHGNCEPRFSALWNKLADATG